LNLIKDNSVIWAAWGNTINSRYWLRNCLKNIFREIKKNKKGIKWKKIRFTNKMNPVHPLCVSYKEEFIEYNMEEIV
jgi:hypothetical protein